ncbi:MAG: division/cell wall cluster transcriptional repressor MraZ [Candidatus Aminicenantia bacterium]
MGENGKIEMLRGSYTVKVDEGGRIKIPEEFRSIIEKNYGKELFITSVNGVMVQVFPLPVWEKIEEKLHNAPSMEPAIIKYIELTSYYGKTSQMDQKGRILIHPHLREKTQLNSEVIILGSQSHLRIWNKELFGKKIDREPLTLEDFKALSVFGI